MKDLQRHRGIATQMFLSALYLEQLRHPRSAKGWTARPIDPDRHDWRDKIVNGELGNPSWATLSIGFQERPRDPAKSKQWHTTRYRAVRKGFDRLTAIGLFDPDQKVLLSEDRRWKANPRIVERTYRRVDTRTERSFVVPASVFTSGLYLRLSGPALHVLLVALQTPAKSSDEWPFHLRALTWKTFEPGFAELKKTVKDPKLLERIERLKRIKDAEVEAAAARRAVSATTDFDDE